MSEFQAAYRRGQRSTSKRVAKLENENEQLRAEVERLQTILDSRPAINAGLPESYIKWSQSIYVLDAVQAGAIPTN